MSREGLSPEVRVFMTEKEVLWYEFEHGFSQQGSSLEGNLWADVPSARALSQAGAEPSGQETDEVDSDNVEVVDSKESCHCYDRSCRSRVRRGVVPW